MHYLRASIVFIETFSRNSIEHKNSNIKLYHHFLLCFSKHTPQATKTPAKNGDPAITKFPTVPPLNICEYNKLYTIPHLSASSHFKGKVLLLLKGSNGELVVSCP